MEIDRTAQTPIVSALQQNRGELDAESLGRMLASVAEHQQFGVVPPGDAVDDQPHAS